jgi:ComF family protein
MAPFLCPVCRNDFTPVVSPMCPACGQMFAGRSGADHLCEACIRKPRAFCTARAAGLYTGALRETIHLLKYRGKIVLAPPLGRLLWETFVASGRAEQTELVVPVPLHPRRMRHRGFNQAYLLVRRWPLTGGFPAVERSALIRQRWTQPQTGLGRRMRVDNIKNAFRVPEASLVKDRQILLVDDVLTTGATVEECAHALLRAGAKRVDVLTLARA